jgi:chromosome segregation ATPase
VTKHFTGKFRTGSAGSSASEEARDLTAAIEERDAAIASLERTLAEQQAHIETLRDAIERAKFQTRILEQSYSKQLGEARERADAAEHAVTELQSQSAELEKAHEQLTKELAEARASLDSFGREALSIDEMLASFEVPRDQPLAHDSGGEADAPMDPQAIEEMLAPDVMFAGKGKSA